MSDDEQEQEVDNRTIRGNSKNGRTTDGEFSKSRSRDLDEALGGEREVPEDAEHVTMAPEHVPMQMRTDDESNSEDE